MCGRYTGYVDDSDEIKSIYTALKSSYPGTKLVSDEIFPTNVVPLLRGGKLEPFPAVWGFPAFRSKGVIINARAETAAEKTMFRDSLLHRRCAVPTTGYFEWSANKTKYRFNLPGENALYLAGIYKQFDDGMRFVILTTAANESVTEVHDRMPIILPKHMLAQWIVDAECAASYIMTVMPDMIMRQA